MASLWQDLRFALRQLTAHRQFTVAALLVLGLGIGATTTIFTVVDGVLLRPLPYHEPDQLVMLWERNLPRQVERNIVSPQNYLDWRDRSSSFAALASFTWSRMTLLGGDRPERVYGRAVTANLFTVFGVAPSTGRAFTPEDMRPHAAPVVILSDGLWKRRFGGDPAIIGRSIHVSGGDVTVVGVMPASFRPLASEDYWDPFQLDETDRTRHGRYAMVVGRLKPGVTRGQAEAEMHGITQRLAEEYPEFDKGWSAGIVGLSDQVVGSSRKVLWMLLGAVSLVLLITCANVGNLMLTRAASRQRELAVRTALGAPGWRLARQWLFENLTLAFIGGGIGLLLASYGIATLVKAGPGELPRVRELALDGRAVAAAAALSFVVGVLIGLPAAFHGRLERLADALRGSGARTTDSLRAARFRSGLVVAQMSLAVVLLFGAGLLVRSIERLAAVDPGFDPANVLTASIDLPPDGYPDRARQTAFFAALTEHLAALPGVKGAGSVNFLPLTNAEVATGFTIIGRPLPTAGEGPVASIRIVDATYLTTMRVPLLSGRGFAVADQEKSAAVVLVSAAFAKKYWPDGDALGHHLKISYADPNAEPEIVGIVGDVRHQGLDAEARETIYYPLSQAGYGSMTVVVRTARDPELLTSGLRDALRTLDRNVPAEDIASMETWMSRSMSDRRGPMMLLAIFAMLAVTIAAVGVYAVLSFAVAQRTRELGVRLALGAQPRELTTMVLRGGMRLAVIGLALGGIAGALAGRTLDKLLFHVEPADPVTLGAVAALLAAVAFVATWLPARRAAGVDPVVALRSE